jgi:hypothetical protein
VTFLIKYRSREPRALSRPRRGLSRRLLPRPPPPHRHDQANGDGEDDPGPEGDHHGGQARVEKQGRLGGGGQHDQPAGRAPGGSVSFGQMNGNDTLSDPFPLH